MKKILTYIFVCVMLIAFPVYNLTQFTAGNELFKENTDRGLSILDNFSSYDVQKAERRVKSSTKKRELYYGGTDAQIKKALKAVDSGKTTYRKLFKNVYIVGDSLMNGLELYNILNSNNLITQVSASFTHLKENFQKIVGLNPPVLILHYGINMIGTEAAHRNNYISTYSKLIKQLKAELPDTRIIISGLFPVDRSIATAPRFKNISSYNKELKKMCAKLGVEFLDSSSVLKAHPECYGVDGIHLSMNFYSKYWLRFIVKEKGIVG